MQTFAKVVGAILGVLLALGASEAGAVPRYSARYGQKCALCHVNPSGGGLRAAYASQKLVPEEIAWARAKPRSEERRVGEECRAWCAPDGHRVKIRHYAVITG